MDPDGKIIKVPLIMEFCAFTFNLPSTSTSHVDNFASTSCSKLWAMLAKNHSIYGNLIIK
jgi:hypothetical protein